MAPNLLRWKHDQLDDMVRTGFHDAEIKDAVKCIRIRSNLRSNLRKYGSTTALRKALVAPIVLNAGILCTEVVSDVSSLWVNLIKWFQPVTVHRW